MVAGFGVVLLMPVLALGGSQWARAVTVGLLAIAAILVVHVSLFMGVWVISLLWGLIRPDAAEHSPFRAETPELAKAFGRHIPVAMATPIANPVAGPASSSMAGAPLTAQANNRPSENGAPEGAAQPGALAAPLGASVSPPVQPS